MSVVGGSHARFDTGAFTAGALGGAGILASALGAGIENLRAVRLEHYADSNIRYLRGALVFSQHKTAEALEGWLGALQDNQDLQRQVDELTLQLKRLQVRELTEA